MMLSSYKNIGLWAQLFKFDSIHDDFAFIGCSAMDNKCEQGLLSGRSVGILYRKNSSMKVSVAGYHSEGRVMGDSSYPELC